MITPFASALTGSISASTFTASKLVARSTSASDTGTLTAAGTVSGAGASEAFTLTGQREVLGSSSFTKLSSAVLSAAQLGTVSFFLEGTKAEGRIIVSTQPANNDTLQIGLTGFTQTYTFKTSLTGAANEVFIGADASATALNLKKAINDEGTEGTHYGTGTAINPYITVSAISGQILTIRDKIGCVRSLSYVLTQGTGTTLSLGLPTGGANGATVATLQIGDVRAYNAVTLDDEALTLDLLPPLTDWYSDWIYIGGQRATIYLDCENVATGIAASYQTTTDSAKTVTRSGAVSISNADNNSQIITPTEVAEYIRLRLNNTNTTAAAVNAKVVTG